MNETIETQALAVRETNGAIGRALSIEALHANLEFIRQVMAREMNEGQDYGKVPGCGDKPGLFQPGAQKLLMTFQLTDKVKREDVRDIPHHIAGHREYAFTLSVCTVSGKEWDGVGTCSTMESKYRFRGGSRKCPQCGKETIIKGKAEYGGGWLCFQRKGGCGAKWPDGATEIEGQSIGKVENDNPADHWNTVRKMAFKRALVHAAINATNTSELWSQDLEDLPQAEAESTAPTTSTPLKSPPPKPAAQSDPDASFDSASPTPPTPAAKPVATPAPIAGAKRIVGVIEKVTKKEGASARGPWSKYGVKIGESWFNTFDKKLGEAAEVLEGSKAIITFSSNERGNTIVTLTPDPPPAPVALANGEPAEPADDVPF